MAIGGLQNRTITAHNQLPVCRTDQHGLEGSGSGAAGDSELDTGGWRQEDLWSRQSTFKLGQETSLGKGHPLQFHFEQRDTVPMTP